MYCSLSSFWQHFDGQQLGQQQQQHRQLHIISMNVKPMPKDPMKIPKAVVLDETSVAMSPPLMAELMKVFL